MEKRKTYLLSLAEKYASDHNIAKETAIREILHHEETREIFSNIRRNLYGGSSHQLSEVWIRNRESKTVLSTSEEVEAHLLRRNRDQLRQASASPFAMGYLGELICWDGSGDMANRIVEGKPLPEIQHESEVVQKYIEGMAAGDRALVNSVDTNITLKQYRKFWQKKRESTATSPYGLHIGHYRSVLEIQYEDILSVHHKLMIIPFKYAIIPMRWAKTVQVLLEKDIGNPWSNRLRIIELFDSQVNAGLQMLIGKRMVYNALKRGQLHPAAYGSVPHRTAQDAILEKTMSLDLMRLNRSCGAMLDCDAKGCYDRIVAPLQSIASRRLGVPKNESIFFARFWRGCEHFVCTKFGISKDSYRSTALEPLFGIGQGNGAGPAYWLSTLVVMFNVLDKICNGIRFQSPMGAKYTSTGLGYVDDVTLCASSSIDGIDNDEIKERGEMEEEEVFEEIKKIGDAWETMLFTNGGKLELIKCFWIFVCWKWIRGIPVLKTPEEIKRELVIKQSEDGSEIKIPIKSGHEAPKVLGCYVAADGTWDREFGRWSTEAASFASRIKQAKLSRVCGSKLYSALWIPKLRYVAPVVCFSRKQCTAIDRKVVRQCLGATGVNRNFPRAVVFGPKKYGGMEWESMASLLVYEKIKFVVTHLRKQDKMGKLLCIMIETIQIQAGLNEEVMNTKIKWQEWVERCWFSNLKYWLDEINGALHVNYERQCPQRQFDRALMEIFDRWGLPKKTLKALNRVRIYLQVIFVSDISTGDGSEIEQEAFEGRRIRHSVLHWPRQIRPTLQDRRLWRRYLKRLCLGGKLICPLGRWMCSPHQIWKYMATEDGEGVLRYENSIQYVGRRIFGNLYQKANRRCQSVLRGFPAKCSVSPVGLTLETDVMVQERRAQEEIFKPGERSVKATMGFVSCVDMEAVRRKWTKGGRWLVGTDGGLKGNIGTCGVSFYNVELKKELITARSAETCGFRHLHSTREEMKAILSAEYVIRECNRFFGEVEQKVDFICDNKSALHTSCCLEKKGIGDAWRQEAELELEMAGIQTENKNIVRRYKWVQSHVDEIDGYELSEEEKINQRADELATMAREEASEGMLTVEKKQIYEKARATLTVRNYPVTKNLREVIRNELFGKEMETYLCNKYGWDEEIMACIDWEAGEAALKSTRGSYQVKILKLIHMWQPTCRVTQRNQQREYTQAKCLECGQLDDQLHYLVCNSELFCNTRKRAWKRVIERMKKFKVDKAVVDMMWYGLLRWKLKDQDQSVPMGETMGDEQYRLLKEAAYQQNVIGWDHLAIGRMSKEWGKCYAAGLPEDKEKDGKVLAFRRELVRTMWDFTLNIWEKHNENVHGSGNRFSNRDIKSIHEVVRYIYTHLQDSITLEDRWLFRESVRSRISQPVPRIIGWLERVLLPLGEVSEAEEIVGRAKRLIHRMWVMSIFD